MRNPLRTLDGSSENLFASGGPLLLSRIPLDEQLANRGLLPKVFMHQVPDLVALTQGMQEIQSKCSTLSFESRKLILSRAFVVLRLIRGTQGIPWAAGEMCASSTIWKLLSSLNPEVCLKQRALVMKQIAQELLRKNGAYAKEKGLDANWMAHREGRHAMYSGRHALHAMSTAGPHAAAQSVERFLPILGDLLSGKPECEWSEDGLLAIFTAMTSAPLAYRLVKVMGKQQYKMTLFGARRYNSMNSGLGMAMWATVQPN